MTANTVRGCGEKLSKQLCSMVYISQSDHKKNGDAVVRDDQGPIGASGAVVVDETNVGWDLLKQDWGELVVKQY